MKNHNLIALVDREKKMSQLEVATTSQTPPSDRPEFLELEKHLLEIDHYQRIDHNVLSQFTQTQLEKNAIHGTLAGYSFISRYHIYHRIPLPPSHPNQEGEEVSSSKGEGVVEANSVPDELVCIIEIGDRLCGHPEIVHGGIISAIFDNSFGWLYMITRDKFQSKTAFTANLNVNFRKPIYANSIGMIKVKIEKLEGRKIFMKASWEWNNEIFADATALFVTPKVK